MAAGLEESFEQALRSLWIAFQPVVRAGPRDTFGFEALVRSSHSTLSNPPALFDTADQLGCVMELEQAIRRCVAERVSNAPDGTVLLVNLHPMSLNDPDLFSNDDPLFPWAERIVLEVTERASLETVVDVEEKVAELRRRGFRIAIDDLGSGYAGLTSLALLHPEFVKFDMSLVRDVEMSQTKSRLIGSMASLCRELGIQTVAEGIERPAERDRIVDLGCDYMQGYLFGRPAKGFAPGCG